MVDKKKAQSAIHTCALFHCMHNLPEATIDCGEQHKVFLVSLISSGAFNIPRSDYASRSYWFPLSVDALRHHHK